MIDSGLKGVDFIVANTDLQVLNDSLATTKLQLGSELTDGLGAGAKPEIGKEAALESKAEIEDALKGADMVFVTCGMGGGTGTGASPIIAEIAQEQGALTVGIVTKPFSFEGKKRIVNSIDGLNKLRENVDSIIVVSNDKLLMTSGNAPIGDAFNESDKILAQSVKTVVNLIMLPAVINLDFADVRNTLKDSGVALIGFGLGTGANRAKEAASTAINSPLLEASISGAKRAIVAVTCGPNVSLFDAQETVNLLINASGHDIDVKFGVTINSQLSDEILVSVIASDFDAEIDFSNPVLFSAPAPKQVEETLVAPDAHDEVEKIVDEKSSSDDFGDDILPTWLNS